MANKVLKPRISIVMSAYNAEEYLKIAVDSILAQTYEDFEFIIINDGSKDRTKKIIETYAKQDHRIKFINQTTNKGLIASLNTGFKTAQGKYIARMDADDVSLPNRLLKQYKFLEANPDTVLLGTLSAYIDEQGKVYGVWPVLLNDQEIRIGIAIHNEFRHGTVMIRNKVVSNNNEFYDPKAAHYEDYEYWPRLMKHGKVANLPEALYLYRETKTNITATKGSEMNVGSRQVVLREQASLQLSSLRPKELLALFRRSKSYEPKTLLIDGKQLKTNLKWQYQLYLIGLAKLYLKKRKYISAFFSIVTCIFVDPFRFLYENINRTNVFSKRH